MSDDPAQPDQDENKTRGLSRLRGKLSAFKKHSSKEANEVDVDDFLRPSSLSPEPQASLIPRFGIRPAKPPLGGGPQVPIYPGHPRATVPDKDYPFEKYQPHRTRRLPRLSVYFALREPELIGEGGDEAEDPPIIVSQQRSAITSNEFLKQITPGTHHSSPGGETSPDSPIIRKPLRRAPTGLEDVQTGQIHFEAPSITSSDYSPSSAKNTECDYSSNYDLSQGDNRAPNRQTRVTPDFGGHSKVQRKRLSLAQDPRQQPENLISRSKTLPHKGLRLMQADEGLVHRSSVRDSLQSAPDQNKNRPSSSRSSPGVSPPRLPAYPGVGLDTERNFSQQSCRSSSPQPFSSYHGSRPSTAEGNYSSSNYSRPSEKSAAWTSQQALVHEYQVQPSLTDNSDALPPPYQQVPPPQGYQGPQENRIPATFDQGSHRPRTASSSRSNMQQGKGHSSSSNSESAVQEFADRVSGTFAIFDHAEQKSEKELPSLLWLRVAIWWFLKGRTGLRTINRGSISMARDPGYSRDEDSDMTSMQCYVDLAKTWWILMRVTLQHESSQSPNGPEYFRKPSNTFEYVHGVLMQALKALAMSLQKRDMMPPSHMMMHRVDTKIWLPPFSRQFPPEWMWTLSSKIFQNPDEPPLSVDPLSALPIGDTQSTAYLGRVFAETSVMYGDELPQHASFPCVLSVIRNKSNMDLQLVISSQNSTVYIVVQSSSAYGVRWEHIRWDVEPLMLRVKLPNKLRLRIFCLPADYEFLRTQCQGSQADSTVLEPRHDELMLQIFQLNMLHYNDSADPTAFPPERQSSARAALFERLTGDSKSPNGRVHQGYRISFLLADTSRPSVNIILDHLTMMEYALDPAHPDMQLRVNEIGRCRRAVIGFQSLQDREMFRDFISGTILGPQDNVRLKIASSGTTFSLPDNALQPLSVSLNWQILQVLETIEANPDDKVKKRSSVKPFQNVRIMMYDKIGSILTRVSSSVGAVQIRLEAKALATLKILHRIDSHRSTVTAGPDLDGLDTVQRVFDLMSKPNDEVIQTCAFANVRDLHLFQAAITGYQVLFDAVAIHFSIPRRRMFVPITQTWGTTGARVQVVRREGLLRLIAFFEGYELADSLDFQVKSSDAFEKVDVKASKGHGDERRPTRGGYGVKLVDAKFLLPGSGKDDEDERNGVNVIREIGAKFVNLDVDQYAMEHEDITIAFETEQGECSLCGPLLRTRHRMLT